MWWRLREVTSSRVITMLVVAFGSARALQAQGADRLYGTWRLETFRQTVVATGETKDFFGRAPRGFLTYGRDGRMIVLIVNEKRPKPTAPDLTKMTDRERSELFGRLRSTEERTPSTARLSHITSTFPGTKSGPVPTS